MFLRSKKKQHFSETYLLLQRVKKIKAQEDYKNILSRRRVRLNTFSLYARSYNEYISWIRSYLRGEEYLKAITTKETLALLDFDYFTQNIDNLKSELVVELFDLIEKFLTHATSTPGGSTNLNRLMKDTKAIIEHAEFSLQL